MASNIMMKILFLLNVVLLTLNKSEQILCSENNTLLETMGDAILTGKSLINKISINLIKIWKLLRIIYIYNGISFLFTKFV